ncbi:hypothetical protein OH77DRAFT_1081961 [Trametes cingulata]|nr:hypothetical protein OH77DRAFT_1081961 [Trametes cingulata]
MNEHRLRGGPTSQSAIFSRLSISPTAGLTPTASIWGLSSTSVGGMRAVAVRVRQPSRARSARALLPVLHADRLRLPLILPAATTVTHSLHTLRPPSYRVNPMTPEALRFREHSSLFSAASLMQTHVHRPKNLRRSSPRPPRERAYLRTRSDWLESTTLGSRERWCLLLTRLDLPGPHQPPSP